MFFVVWYHTYVVSTHTRSTRSETSSRTTNYAIVSYLDPETTERIRALQLEIAGATGSRGSIEGNQPHITVGSEVSVTDDEYAELVARIEAVAKSTPAYPVVLSGFGFMYNWTGGALPDHTPYVAYVKVNENLRLERLVQRIRDEVTVRYNVYYALPLPYDPHVTLAYKDLTRDGLDRAQEYLAQRAFMVETVITEIALACKDVHGKRFRAQRFLLRG